MNVKSTSELRKTIAKAYGETDPSIDTNFIGSYEGDPATGKKGFFKVFHGISPNIANYLRGVLKIAEDGQAVYEFIQNAVDCNSRNFWLYITEDYFLAINNGEPFKEKDITAILNIGQSDKGGENEEGKCDNIGRFGIGFKLVHRLVGKNDGIDELCTIKDGGVKGPILLSWTEPIQLKSLLEWDGEVNSLNSSEKEYPLSPWLFKILLTNFPAQVNEEVRDMNYRKIVPFPITEFEEMRSHISGKIKPDFDESKFSKGSIFYIKLGNGKYEKLLEEMESLENGVNYSLNFFKKLHEITINDKVIRKKKIDWLFAEIPIDSEDFNEIDPEYKLCPIKIWFGYPNSVHEIEAIKLQPSFYKYFPLGDEVNQLGFVINCDAFDIETNRRKLHKSKINEILLSKISKILISKFENLQGTPEFDKIFLSVLFSESKTDEASSWKTKALIKEIKDYFLENIPIDSGYDSFENCVIKGFKSNISLSEVGLEDKNWFKWESWLNPEITERASEELGIKKWYLRNLIHEVTSEQLENYLKSLGVLQYMLFFKEILSEEQTATLKNDLGTKNWLKLNNGEFASLSDFTEDEAWCEPDLTNKECDTLIKFGKPTLNITRSAFR